MHSTSTLPVPPQSESTSTPATATPPAPSYDVMERLFQPKTVAIIGASSTPNTVGRALVENMAAFEGTLYLINPKHPTVLDRPAFPSVSALPTVPDLVVIATPAAGIPALLRECGKKGVPAAVVVSAGFKEIGPEGAALEKQVIEAAAESGMRIIGPNCLGVMIPHLKLNATFAADMARPGKVAFLSQSGALCTAVLDWSLRDNIGFSAFVSVGSMADLAWGDLISYFGDDPNTRSIVCYMESVGDARAFLTAAREVARDKPIIVIKVGHTEAAAKVAASHTGSLTGSDSVLDAAFQRAGVLRVNTITELFSMAEVLAKQPRPTGPRLAIVTNAGGPGALATDMLITCGAKLAELEPATIATLNKVLPAPWSHGNPIDVLGDANAGRYGAAIEAANADPNVDGLLVILTPQAMTDAAATAKELQRLSAQISKPILASWMGAESTAEGQAILNAANIPTFDCPDIAAKAFALMWKHSQNLKALYETPELATQDITLHQRQAVETLIQGVRATDRTLLTEAESKAVLRTYGIPTVETRTAVTEEEAVACGKSIGYPLVLKLLSKTITHKTDVGGVELDLRSEEAVRSAWRRIESSVTSKVGKEHFQGVTVQPMIDRGGYELILGSTIDPQFGPVILFGTGGQLVEVFKDRSLGLPPLNATLARRLMEQTRIYQALARSAGTQRGRHRSADHPAGALQPSGVGTTMDHRDRHQPAAGLLKLHSCPRRPHRAGAPVHGGEHPAPRGHPPVSQQLHLSLDPPGRIAGAPASHPTRGRAGDDPVPRHAVRAEHLFALLQPAAAGAADRPRSPQSGLLPRLRPGDRTGCRADQPNHLRTGDHWSRPAHPRTTGSGG